MVFEPGKSGNPAGRKPGSANRLTAYLREHKDLNKIGKEIFRIALMVPDDDYYDSAMKTACLKLIADKCVPSLKAQEVKLEAIVDNRVVYLPTEEVPPDDGGNGSGK